MVCHKLQLECVGAPTRAATMCCASTITVMQILLSAVKQREFEKVKAILEDTDIDVDINCTDVR